MADEKAKHFTAIKFGKHKEVKTALDAGELLVTDKDSKGDTPIHVAARNGHKKIVKELLRQRADGAAKSDSGKPAWQLAVDSNYIELADYIREKHLLPPLTEDEKAGGTASVDAVPAPVAEPSVKNSDSQDIAEVLGLGETDSGGRREKKHSREADGDKAERRHSREKKEETEDERRERKKDKDSRRAAETIPATSSAASAVVVTRPPPEALPPEPPKTKTWRDYVDFDFLIKSLSPLGSTVPLDAQSGPSSAALSPMSAASPPNLEGRDRCSLAPARMPPHSIAKTKPRPPMCRHARTDAPCWNRFYRELERFKDALGEGSKAAELERVVGQFWGRFTSLHTAGGELAANARLQAELKTLQGKMGGDVDKILDDVQRLESKLKQAESDKEELASQLKSSLQELKGGEGRVSELTRQVEDLKRQLRDEAQAREDEHEKLAAAEKEADDRGREARRLADEVGAAQRRLEAVRGDLTRVKEISVSFIPPHELEAMFMRHDKDKSGEISAEEMKPLVEELCRIMEGRVADLRQDVEREQRRVEESDRDRERERGRAGEREEQLLGQIGKLEIDVRESEERGRKQVHLMEERLEGTKKQHEARMEREREDREAEVARVRAEGEQLLKRERERSEREAADREQEFSRDKERLQARVDSQQAELDAEKSAAKSITDRFHGAVKQLRASQKQVERLEKEAKASKAQSTIRMLGDFRTNLTESRKELRTIRNDVLSLADKIQAEVSTTLEGIAEWCTFILPLPFEQPEQVRTDALSKNQLAGGLRHMMGKYRHVSEECRKLNVELQNLVRPLRQIEAEGGSSIHLRGNGLLSLMDKHADSKDFQFDQAYGPRSTQEQVFGDARPLMQTLIDGYNVSVFAYGPTGSGKTYTMAGDVKGASKHKGLTYRMVEDLFRTQRERAVLAEMEVSLSMFEIYNEVARDLLPTTPVQLGKEPEGLKIQQDKRGQVAIEGLADHPVDNVNKALALIEHGMAARAVGATNLNEHSSRSHLLIRLTMRSVDKKTGQRYVGKMYLVDLAGSENVGHSGAEGKALREAIGINKSLAALHDVMLALSSNKEHIPYRNSTLTKVLADSLGGQAKCLMYVMISPAMRERVNALAALKFASRCKDILLSPAKQNVDKDPLVELEEAKAAVARYKLEAEKAQSAVEGQEGQSKLSRELLQEHDRFEAKLRELFGLPAGKKKDKGKGAQYLDKDSMAIISKRTHNDDLLSRIARGIEAFTLALREQDGTIAKLEAANGELKTKVESYRAQRDHQLRKSGDGSVVGEAWADRSRASHSRERDNGADAGSPSRRPGWDARTKLGGHPSVRARVEARIEAARWWGPTARAPFQATPNSQSGAGGVEGGEAGLYKEEKGVVDKRAHSVPQVPQKPSFGRLPYIGGGLG